MADDGIWFGVRGLSCMLPGLGREANESGAVNVSSTAVLATKLS